MIRQTQTIRRYDASARRTGGVRFGVSLAVGVALIAIAVGGCDSAASGHPTPHPAATTHQAYGSLPSYLPTDPVPADRALIGTTAKPALASQGDTVDVRRTGGGSVRATVTGPAVPAQGLSSTTPIATCTFTISLQAGTRRVAVRVADFAIRDHFGARHALRPVASPAPSPVLEPGRSTSFQLRAFLPTGEGLVRWAPDARHVVASWDFVVETD